MKKALYGHPDSGTVWERHCEKMLGEVGFMPAKSWNSCFWNEKLKLLVTVYVDDLKMSGPSEALDAGWNLIRSKIAIGDVSPASLYLGCIHTKFEMNVNGTDISVMEYNMELYLKQIVEDYEELASELQGKTVKLGTVSTPFLDEDCSQADARAPISQGDPLIDCPYCRHSFSPITDLKTREELKRYLEHHNSRKDHSNDVKPGIQHSETSGIDCDGTDHGEDCAVGAEDKKAGQLKSKSKAASKLKSTPGQIVMPAKKFAKSFKKIKDRAAKEKKLKESGDQEE